MQRAVIIQLARLGDLIQTVPAITAIKTAEPDLSLDLLCPKPLAPIGRMVPGIERVLEWDGKAWQLSAQEAMGGLRAEHVGEAEARINALAPQRYDRAYVLNQHPRALLAGALLAREVIGPRLGGPLGERLTPWAGYLRDVALTRRESPVHLADAFCGLCGVHPPGVPPAIHVRPGLLPENLEQIGRHGGPWIGLIIGAGDAERLVPIEVWRCWILRLLEEEPLGRVVVLGQERERGRYLHDVLPPSVWGRVWDATGRTSLPDLALILSRCSIVVGSDTGPLHLAAAVGTKVFGLYFARARVYRTGPYGVNHVAWQAEGGTGGSKGMELGIQPAEWPIDPMMRALKQGQVQGMEGWSAWLSHCDQWGAYYTGAGQCPVPSSGREELWRELSVAAQR